MKKISLFLLLVIPQIVFSQRFSGGIVAGFNASQIDGDFMYGYNKAGLMGGAYVFTDFNAKWKGQMEIRYSAKGSASPKTSGPILKYRLQYIELPLIVEYKLFKKVQLQVGASFGYLFSAVKNDDYGNDKITDQLNPTEATICVGLNASYLDPLNFNIRYSYSIFPVFENYQGQSYGTGAWYNNLFTFGIYYRIGKKSYS